MKVTPVSSPFMSFRDEEGEDHRRQRLIMLLKELALTSPELAWVNRKIAESGDLGVEACQRLLEKLEGQTDRRSLRARYIVNRILSCKNVND